MKFCFKQMKHCCVEDPVDLCSINISGEKFSDVKAEDFQLFDNVAYVNASENFLSVGEWSDLFVLWWCNYNKILTLEYLVHVYGFKRTEIKCHWLNFLWYILSQII